MMGMCIDRKRTFPQKAMVQREKDQDFRQALPPSKPGQPFDVAIASLPVVISAL